MRTLEDNTFLLLIIAVSLAFAWILWPFYGAVLWGLSWQSCLRRFIGGCRAPCRSGATSLPSLQC